MPPPIIPTSAMIVDKLGPDASIPCIPLAYRIWLSGVLFVNIVEDVDASAARAAGDTSLKSQT
jgi:hypothetical protein